MEGYDHLDEDMIENEMDEELNEILKCLLISIQAILHVLHELMQSLCYEHVARPLTRRLKTRNGSEYISKILKEDGEHFRQIYSIYPEVFWKLCYIIREKTQLDDTRFVTVEEMLAIFLLNVGQNSRYCVIHEKYDQSLQTTSKNFNKILKALNIVAVDMVVKPGVNVLQKISESTRFYPYLKDCIGAIDGTYIPAIVTKSDTGNYRNRHGFHSQNVLAACNFNLEFIYMLSGWEGSAHDSRILTDALSRKNGLQVPQGKYFLVDCGFSNRHRFLAPFRGVRYHLLDFSSRGHHPENANELFNLQHVCLSNIIERLFGIFKSRFTIFETAPPFLYKTQAKSVLACVGLHSFLPKECRFDEFPIEKDNEGLLSDDEEDPELLLETQEQQREQANEWRATIASNMWHDIEIMNGVRH